VVATKSPIAWVVGNEASQRCGAFAFRRSRELEEIIKICVKCSGAFTLDKFYKKKDSKFGVSSLCKQCDKKRWADYYLTDKCQNRLNEWGRKQEGKYELNTHKHCNGCGGDLALDAFYKKKMGKYGVGNYCKQCKNNRCVEYKKSESGHLYYQEYYKSERGKEVRERYNQTEKGKETVSRWWRSSKGKAKSARNHSRRRVRKNILSTLTAAEWEEIKKQYKYRCVYCGEKRKLTMDHIIPLSKGGHHVKENIVPACLSCNSKKGDRPVLLQILVLAST